MRLQIVYKLLRQICYHTFKGCRFCACYKSSPKKRLINLTNMQLQCFNADMSEEQQAFIYFEAKPKRGNAKVVREKIWWMMGLFAEIFDKQRRNCNFHPETRGSMWTVLITFESEEAKSLLDQDPRFQEAMTDLRVYCKPAHRLRRMIHYAFRPNRPFVINFKEPITLPRQEK